MKKEQEEELYSMAHAVLALAERVLKQEQTAGSAEQQAWWALLCAFLLKAANSLRATVLLCRKGLSEDAAILARSIMEIAIMSQYIAREWRVRSRRFIEHIAVERKRFADSAQAASDRVPEAWDLLAGCPERLKEMAELYNEMGDDARGHRYRWVGLGATLRDLAKDIELHDLYSLVYSQFSWRAHSTPQCMNFYVRDDGGRLICSPPEPAPMLLAALGFGSLSLLLVLSVANEQMCLALDPEIGALERRFQEVWRAACRGGADAEGESGGRLARLEDSE